MKKIVYLVCSLFTALTSCEPMEDVYDELDSLPKDPTKSKNFNIVLSEANYKFFEGKTGVPAHVNKNYYFASETEASTLIPLFLNATYAHLDNGDAINVTYNTSTFVPNNTVAERVSYTLTTQADYSLGGANFQNFDKFSQIETFLNAKYPTPLEGRLATLTYTLYNSNTSPTSRTVTDTYYYVNGKWFDTYVVTADDYLSVDRNRNNAFASADEAEYVPAALNKFLKDNILGAKAGDVQFASYLVRYSSTSTLTNVMAMVYDGANWSKVSKAVTQEATLTFGKKDGVWAPDLTIRYTLTADDYTAIGNNPAVGTQANRDNLKQFKNFYQVGNATDTRYWTEAQIFAGLAARLKELYPNADVGQKVQLSYIVYRGSNNIDQTTFIKEQSGDFVVLPK